MDAADHVPRIMEEDSHPVMPAQADSSKWAAVHDALENTTSRVAPSSGTGSLFTVAWVLGITLGLLWVLRNGRTVFNQWQENVHRRANRRRHGIPDDDDRPFNVAYAAAALARRQREQQERAKLTSSRHQPPRIGSEWERHGETIGLRQRPSHPAAPILSSSGLYTPPMFLQGNSANPLDNQRTDFGSTSHRTQFRSQPAYNPQFEPHDWSDPYNANYGHNDAQPNAQGPPFRSANVDGNSQKILDVVAEEHAPPEHRKHRHVDDANDGDRTTKRTRVDGEEFIDGDNDAAWVAGGSRRGSLQVPKRGSKRHANPDDDEWEMSKDKRARKGSALYLENTSDAEDIDMDPGSSDVEPEPARGTKREREVHDSAVDGAAYDTDESQRPRLTRKRRTFGMGDAEETISRGIKRDRSHERPIGSDEEGEESDVPEMRHKRGRRHEQLEEQADITPSDASESDELPEISNDPACGGHRIGEEWVVNGGQSFKVGLDGRRLRKELLRQRRSKFAMPKDSAHSDAKTDIEVIVEKWLNDDEYKAAKDKYELVWQDPSPVSTPKKTEVQKREEPPSSGGKRLLWEGPPPSPLNGRASTRSVSSVQNPFDLAPSNAGRRVASAHLLMNNPAESPKLRSSKSFSKWEKQDLEASSLKKMRARMEKEQKEKEKEQQEKEREKEKPKATMPPAPTPTPLAPTTNTQAQPPLTTPPVNQSTLGAKPTAAPAPAAPSPNPFAKPASTPPSSSLPSFSFTKPTSTPSTTTPTAAQPSPTSSFSLPTQSSSSSPFTAAPPVAKPAFPAFPSAPAPASGSTPSEPNKGTTSKPSFSFTPAPSTPSSVPAASGTSKPSFRFASPQAQTNKIEAPKVSSSFSFATPPASSTTSSEPVKAITPSPFGNPAPQPAVGLMRNPPSGSPFHVPSPVSNSPFMFNATPQLSTGATQKPSAFQFGQSTAAQNISEAPSGSTPSSGSGSLMNRMAPASASTTQNVWSKPSGGATSAFAAASNTPNTSQPSASIFGQNQSQLQSGSRDISESVNKPTPFTPSEPSKNIFGQPSSTTTPPAFSFAKVPATSDPPKPVMPTFGKPEGSAQQSKPFSFNFGTAGNTSASNASPSTNPFQPPSTGAPGNPFTFGQPSPTTPSTNPFGFQSKPAEGEKK